MIDPTARCPKWLISRISSNGGSVSFYKYMDLVLNDPDYGFYSTGRLRIGKNGDFCTSPSLSDDFARLLSVQVVEWFLNLEKAGTNSKVLSLVEMGPGEGTLSADLINHISKISPSLIKKIELVLVEPNRGMKRRQRKVLNKLEGLSFRWSTLEDLALNPVTGVIIANEVFDTFPVERLVFRENKFFRQGVSLFKRNEGFCLEFVEMKTTCAIDQFLRDAKNILNIDFPPEGLSNGWVTEWHRDIPDCFKNLSNILLDGSLLVVDYAMESRRYYNKIRKTGNLISYRDQKANSNILVDPGLCDLTAHICIESTITYAINNGWKFLGETRQGQALLALGLSQMFHSLQNSTGSDLSFALSRREALLRLVDPMGLGEFRWLAFQKNSCSDVVLRNRFLEEPIS